MSATIILNTTSSDSALAKLKARAPLAMARAINRSIASGKTLMVRLVSVDMGLKQADIRDKIVVVSATPDRLMAQLRASAKRIPLIDFKARGPEPSRGRGRGVTAKMPGGKGRYPNAFIAQMSSGHRGVFARSDRRRLPIRELFGPSIAFVFSKHVEQGQARALEQLEKNIQSEFRFISQVAA